jgi:hypothetical protein
MCLLAGLKLQQRFNPVVRDETATNGMKPSRQRLLDHWHYFMHRDTSKERGQTSCVRTMRSTNHVRFNNELRAIPACIIDPSFFSSH